MVDDKDYTVGMKIPDEEYEKIIIERDEINPLWNYTIKGLQKGK